MVCPSVPTVLSCSRKVSSSTTLSLTNHSTSISTVPTSTTLLRRGLQLNTTSVPAALVLCVITTSSRRTVTKSTFKIYRVIIRR